MNSVRHIPLSREKTRFRLFSGEKLVSVEKLPIRKHLRYPVAAEVLTKLARVNSYRDIGKHGPLQAATVSTVNKDIKVLRLFEVIFGRDALITSFFLADQYPLLLRNTIFRLAELQGIEYHVRREEEPGRIIHEYRDPSTDKRARELTKKLGWEWPYYGSVDATLLFILGIYRYFMLDNARKQFLSHEYTARDGQRKILLEALIGAINWVLTRMEQNPQGLLESKPSFPGSLEVQSWKDSWDAYHHADKSIANYRQGIASIEVQGMVYDVLLLTASLIDLIKAIGIYSEKINTLKVSVGELRERALYLRSIIMQYFWIDTKGGYFALGTDRDSTGRLRPLRIRTSNMGHLLNSRLLDGKDPEIVYRKEVIIRQLFSKEMLNVSGIRTLAKGDGRFRPGSYQNGSVWPWDTYWISLGLRRQGYHTLADNLEDRLLSVIDNLRMYPEFARGDDESSPSINENIITAWDDVNSHENVIEQPPQEYQAWTAAAISAIEYTRTRWLFSSEYKHRPLFNHLQPI